MTPPRNHRPALPALLSAALLVAFLLLPVLALTRAMRRR